MSRPMMLSLSLAGLGALMAVAVAPQNEARAKPAAVVSVVAAGASAANPAGKALFMRCAACHAVSASAPKKLGPHLGGIVGRKSAQDAKFKYSPAMQKAKLTWTRAELDAFLARPSSKVPGTSMAFAGISDAKQRAALVDYLATLK